jgi:hypothetical protein
MHPHESEQSMLPVHELRPEQFMRNGPGPLVIVFLLAQRRIVDTFVHVGLR